MLAATLLIAFGVAQAALYTYYSTGIGLAPVPPPVVLDIYPGQAGVNGSTGPNKTSAAVVVKAVKDYILITHNSYFDEGAEGWYYYYDYSIYYGTLDSYLFTATVLDNYNGADNVTLLYGDLNVTAELYIGGLLNIYRATAAHIQLLVQEVTLPSSPPEEIVLNVTHMEQVYINAPLILSASCSIVVGLYDRDTGSFAWYNDSVACTGSWNTTSYNVNTSAVEPGKTYLLVAGVYVAADTIGIGQYTMELLGEGFFDSVELFYLPQYPSFSGPVIGVNVTTGTYEAQLLLYNYSSDPGVNITVRLVNVSLVYNGNISIVNGEPVSNETGLVEIQPPPQGYYSAKIVVDASLPQNTSANLSLVLSYTTGGVVVKYYYVNITVKDPPPSSTSLQRPGEPVPLVPVKPGPLRAPGERVAETSILEKSLAESLSKQARLVLAAKTAPPPLTIEELVNATALLREK